ncbi:MAG: zinc ribbon domain-containing protein [Vicinamibacterales bacterium]|jgi:putative FmdB family regulatory protein|nr:zinc ribbon domain-containing protein [Vicinamibacterales bacterium]
MPLYEYQCDSCGHRFEQIQRFSDPLLAACPECDGALQKLVSSPAIQFKGTGWYVTDYAKKGSEGPAASEAGTSADGKNATSEKSDKPDTPAKKDAASPDSSTSSDTSKKASGSSTSSSNSTS